MCSQDFSASQRHHKPFAMFGCSNGCQGCYRCFRRYATPFDQGPVRVLTETEEKHGETKKWRQQYTGAQHWGQVWSLYINVNMRYIYVEGGHALGRGTNAGKLRRMKDKRKGKRSERDQDWKRGRGSKGYPLYYPSPHTWLYVVGHLHRDEPMRT